MSIFKDEKQLTGYLYENLKHYFPKVIKRVNLTNRKFEEIWSHSFGYIYHPSQPEIDILIVNKEHKVYVAEIKYFKKYKENNMRANASYYEGIDQALALLRLGFDGVSLWHIFDEELAPWVRHKYETATKALIRTLKLPIKYVPLLVNEENDKIYFDMLLDGAPIQPRTEDGTKAIHAYEGYLYMTPNNPFQNNIDSKKIFSIIKLVLKIPTIT